MANTIEVGSKWTNRKTGKICIVSDVNEKFKTLEYYPEEMAQEDENKRKYTSTSWATFKKSWRVIESVEDEKQAAPVVEKKDAPVPKKQTKEAKKDVSRETSKQEEVPQEKKPRKKRDVSQSVLDAKKTIFDTMEDLGGSVGGNREESMTFRALRHADGRQICKLMWTTKAIKLYFRYGGILNENTNTVVCETVNYALPYRATIIEPTKKDCGVITALLQAAYEDETARQKCKEEKKNKKKAGVLSPAAKSKKGAK